VETSIQVYKDPGNLKTTQIDAHRNREGNTHKLTMSGSTPTLFLIYTYSLTLAFLPVVVEILNCHFTAIIIG